MEAPVALITLGVTFVGITLSGYLAYYYDTKYVESDKGAVLWFWGFITGLLGVSWLWVMVILFSEK